MFPIFLFKIIKIVLKNNYKINCYFLYPSQGCILSESILSLFSLYLREVSTIFTSEELPSKEE